MTDSQPQSPTVALTLTGLRDLYFFLGQIATIATDQRDAIKPLVMELMGDKKELMTPDGWTFRLVEGLKTEFDKSQLRMVLDADQMDVVTKVDTKAVEKLLKEIGLPKEKLSELEKGKIVTGETKALKLMPPTKETMGLIRK